MQTYTVRALSSTDAALVREAADRLGIYENRTGLTHDNDLSGAWDMRQAAVLAVHLRTALDIIEKITRPRDPAEYCRTCGFTDCPASGGGDCPRWHAR